MGGFKQCYYITTETDTTPEQVYLTFGNRAYARKIFCALKECYETTGGFKATMNPEEGYLYLTNEEQKTNIIFRFYQKHLMWEGELPDDLKFLENFIPENVEKINGKS